MNEDLKWLAENVHEWPKFGESRDGLIIANWDDIEGHVKPEHGSTYWTKDDWQAARDELSGKPSWGDHKFNAIEQAGNGDWYGSKKSECNSLMDAYVGEWEFICAGSLVGGSRNTLERRPDTCKRAIEKLREIGFDADKAIKSTSVTGRWRGPEDGLPPVNSIIEYNDNGAWVKTRVLGHHPDKGKNVLWHQSVDGMFEDGRNSSTDSVCFFRPIQSKEDKAVEEMMESCAIGAFYGAGGGAINDNAFEALFRQMFHAGYRKQESE